MAGFDQTQTTEKKVKAYLSADIDEQKLHFYQTVRSTNQTAKEMALTGAKSGSFVIADAQTGGRGRGDNRFFSPAGGIYLSVIYKEKPGGCLADYLTVAGCAVTVRAIEAVIGVQCGIKWVNDLFVRGKKVCGILAESVFRGKTRYMILGIGINLFMPSEGFPKDLPRAGAVLDTPPDGDLRARLIAGMIDGLTLLGREKDFDDYVKTYRERSMIISNDVVVTDGDECVRGVVRGFDDYGYLILETDGGRRIISAGTLRLADEQE